MDSFANAKLVYRMIYVKWHLTGTAPIVWYVRDITRDHSI